MSILSDWFSFFVPGRCCYWDKITRWTLSSFFLPRRVWKLISVTMLSRPDRFEPVGCETARDSYLLLLLLAAVPRRQRWAHTWILFIPTSLGVGGARRSAICPACLPAKGRCAMLFHTTWGRGKWRRRFIHLSAVFVFSLGGLSCKSESQSGLKWKNWKSLEKKKAALPKITP